MLTEKQVKDKLRLCNPGISAKLCAALQMTIEESEVIAKNYYLDKTESQIADEIAVSRATVQRIKKRALQKIIHASHCINHLATDARILLEEIFF